MSIIVIYEAGINGNGNLELIKQMMNVAKSSGCDLFKLQKRCIDKVYTKEFLDSPRESPWGHTQRDQKNKLEFNTHDYDEIDKYSKYIGLPWFASAWDTDSQKFLQQYDCSYNKVASAMLTNFELLRMIAQEHKHTFISTGMASMHEIHNAVDIFVEFGCSYEIMHCVSVYPMDAELANLRMINTLKEEFHCKVGYSNHHCGLSLMYAAAAMGITSLEFHGTLEKSMYGSDQAASFEPSSIYTLVGGIRKIEKAMGDGIKRLSSAEIKVRDKLRGK